MPSKMAFSSSPREISATAGRTARGSRAWARLSMRCASSCLSSSGRKGSPLMMFCRCAVSAAEASSPPGSVPTMAVAGTGSPRPVWA